MLNVYNFKLKEKQPLFKGTVHFILSKMSANNMINTSTHHLVCGHFNLSQSDRFSSAMVTVSQLNNPAHITTLIMERPLVAENTYC